VEGAFGVRADPLSLGSEPAVPDLIVHGPPSSGRAVLLLPGFGDTSAVFTDRLDLIDPDGQWMVAVAEPVTRGPEGPMWYVVDEHGPDPEGVASATAAIDRALDEVARLAEIARTDVVIGGHSQGGAAALATLLDPTCGPPPAAAVVLAGYLPHREGLLDGTRVDARPVLAGHATRDRAGEIVRGRSAGRGLGRWGADVTWREVDGGHRLGPHLLAPLRDWLADLAAGRRPEPSPP